MAEAYAAVVSVQHIIDKIKHHHASHIKSVGANLLIDALRERAILLQDFLETYSGGPDLASRIADAAHAAEDVLESHIMDRIHAVRKNKKKKWSKFLWEIPHVVMRKIRSIRFDQSLEKVIIDMDVIVEKSEVKKLKLDVEVGKRDPTNTSSALLHVSSPTPLLPSAGTHMVGFVEYLNQLLEKLIGQGLNRQVIPIFGMGGMGKTTLAKNIHAHPLVIQHFDRRAWVAISQQYNVRKILTDLLFEISGVAGGGQEGCEDRNLGEKLHKELWNRRYLIVLDDMWSLEAWDELKLYFPESDNGSRIIITTRMSNLASSFGFYSGIKLDLLDEYESWNLFCRNVFGYEDNFPYDIELEILGRMIVRKCKGLPLSIVAIGGLLAKSHKTIVYWEYVLGNLNSIVNLDDNEHCLKILLLSYTHLPIHLKPCFLYMGLLPEDTYISAYTLLQLWVAEGFLKPNEAKSMEEVASDYLNDLIDRNLIIVRDNLKPTRRVNRCGMHDLLRDVCLREAQKDKFFFLVNSLTYPNIGSQRRLAIEMGMEDGITKDDSFVRDLESASLIRSFTTYDKRIRPSPIYRLLRVLEAPSTHLGCEIFEHVNLRYLSFSFVLGGSPLQLPSSINLLWNLETLIIRDVPRDKPIAVPVEIWGMLQLRVLCLYKWAILPQPPKGHSDNHENSLQMIGWVVNFKLTEDVIHRISNVKELQIECADDHQWMESSHDVDGCGVKNLHRLVNLERLSLFLFKCPHSPADNWQQSINFPSSLKELRLFSGKLPWESMTKMGSLPHLEGLYLYYEAFTGDEWNPVNDEEQIFPSLKFLEIEDCRLKYWNADQNCFPHLERLVLEKIDGLEEIPSDIANIPTLEFISVKRCSQGVVDSAKEMLREQRSFGNETLQIYISDDEDE